MFLKYVLRLLFHFVDETEYDEVIEANAELIEKKMRLPDAYLYIGNLKSVFLL